MRLSDGFVTHELDGKHVMVCVKEGLFSGIVRSNDTAGFIVECLKEETDEDKIADAIMAKYDISDRETVAKDVAAIIDKLRSINAITE